MVPTWNCPRMGRGQFTLLALFYFSSQHKQGGQGGLCQHLTGLFNNNNNNNKSPKGLGQINMSFNANGPITLPCPYACVHVYFSLSSSVRVCVCFQIRNCKKCVSSTHTHLQAYTSVCVRAWSLASINAAIRVAPANNFCGSLRFFRVKFSKRN